MPREKLDRLDRQRVRRRVRVAADVALDRLRERVHAALSRDLRRKAQRQLRVHQRRLRHHELVPDSLLGLRLLVGEHRDARAFGARARRRRRGDEEERRLFEIALASEELAERERLRQHRRDDLARVECAAAADRDDHVAAGIARGGDGAVARGQARVVLDALEKAHGDARGRQHLFRLRQFAGAAQRRAARHQQRAPAVSPADLAEARKRPRSEQDRPGINQLEIHCVYSSRGLISNGGDYTTFPAAMIRRNVSFRKGSLNGARRELLDLPSRVC